MGGLVSGEDKEGVVSQGEDGNGVRRVGLKWGRGGFGGGWRRTVGGESVGRRPEGEAHGDWLVWMEVDGDWVEGDREE